VATNEVIFDNAVFQGTLAQRSSEIVGILWHQGENDSVSKDNAQQYHDKFLNTIYTLFEKLNLPKTTPVIIGELGEFIGKYRNGILGYYKEINQVLENLSKEFYPKEYCKKDEFKLVSVGRLHEIKGYDMAINAAYILKKENINFKWYVVGEGTEREKLEKLIEKQGLENNFFLIGLRENPYPYIANANCLVQPSRFEGKSVVLDEAKILNVPILVTNYNTAKDQIDHLKNGIIVDMNAESIAEGIMELLKDKNLLNSIKTYSQNHNIIDYNIEKYMEGLCGDDE
jgi:glycosyltransferase involved in cell wall biosynthesis